jgi:hypothetical protein
MLAYLDTIIAFAVIMLGLSLLITILNQTISAFLGYRGSNLRWGISTMLSTLAPGLSAQARDIANQLLTGPLVSDSIFSRLKGLPVFGRLSRRWRLASAIGPDALVRALDEVSKTLPGPAAGLVSTLVDDSDWGARRKLKMVRDTIGATLASPNFNVQLDDLLKGLGNSAQQSVGKVEAWFDIAMKRVSQRFTMQIRMWTIAFAFLLAFGIQLNSLDLFNQLLGNPALRQKLVDQGGAMLKEADSVLGTPTTGSQSTEMTVSPEVLTGQMKELIDKDLKPEEAKGLTAAPKFNNISEAETWLSNNLPQGTTDDRKRELQTKYRSRVISGLRAKAKDISDLFQKAGIQLMPKDRKLPGWNCFSDWARFFWPDSKRSLAGILLTAVLLSLGAPFWYNALKTLTNLRPMVATKQDQQKQEAAS